MPITMTLSYTADLALPLKKVQLQSAFLTGDELSHRFQVDVCRAGEPVQLSGAAVTGYFIRPDGATVSIPGLAEDSCVTLTLPAACYRLPGRFSLVIRLMQDDVKTAVFWAEGAMTLSATDTLVDDGVIPSLDDLLAQIDAMEKATAAANEAADTVMQKLNSGELHGKGLTILGYYDTLDMLIAAVSQPAAGDAYAIGLQAPYDTYIWNGTKNEWVNNGPLQGVPGDPGPAGGPGEPGRDGASAQLNLLDNSNFRNPVNQREAISQSTAGQYFIDRWLVENSGGLGKVSVDDAGLTLQSGASGYIGIIQHVPVARVKHLNGKTVTMAYCDTDGNVYAQAVTAGSGSTQIGALNIYSTTFTDTYAAFYFRLTTANTTVKMRWAALYEGEYTADTLPPYIPKGYAVELLECQRYYYVPAGAANMAYAGYTASAANARITVPTPVPMRTTPSIVVGTIGNVQVYASDGSHNATGVTVLQLQGDCVALQIVTSGLTAWTPCTMRFNTSVALSADL